MKKQYYYLFSLAKENIFYILAFVSILIAIFFSIFFLITKSAKNNEDVQRTRSEIADLRSKIDLVKLKDQLKLEGLDIDEINKILVGLVPESEDYFSIITALEKISLETGFFITEYQVNLNSSKATNLSLKIYGMGDNDAFLEFLRNYNFAGGRLVTINQIDFSNKSEKGNMLNLSFYSGKPLGGASKISVTAKDKELLKKIISKVKIEYSFTSPVNLNYPTKQNPF